MGAMLLKLKSRNHCMYDQRGLNFITTRAMISRSVIDKAEADYSLAVIAKNQCIQSHLTDFLVSGIVNIITGYTCFIVSNYEFYGDGNGFYELATIAIPNNTYVCLDPSGNNDWVYNYI